jgi:hypothetical protein
MRHSWKRGISEPSVFRQRPFQMKVRAPCEGCNKGWMSNLEGRAKAIATGMIQGRGRELHRQGQTTLATWAALKALMFARTTPKLPVKPEIYQQLYDDPTEPPPGTFVWIARADGSDPAFWKGNGLGSGPEIDPMRTEYPDWFISTLGINHLVLQVVFNNGPIQELRHGVDIAAAVTRIWPIDKEALVWPATRTLSPVGLRRLADIGA